MTEVPCPNPNIWHHLVLCCGLFDLDLRHNIGKAGGFLRITRFVEGVEASLASFILVMRLDLTRIKRLFECERSRRRRLPQNCNQGMPP